MVQADESEPQANARGGAPAQGGSGFRNQVINSGNQKRMISELERINALNLEPSLPKVDDGTRGVSRYWQDRDKVKQEFQQFLGVMKGKDDTKGSGASEAGGVTSAGARKQGSSQASSGVQQGSHAAA